MSAMFIFSEEKRRQLQEERPELSESELTRLLARMWNDLSEKKKVGVLLAFVPQGLAALPQPWPVWAPVVPGLGRQGWELSRPEGGKLSEEGLGSSGEQSWLAGQAGDLCTSPRLLQGAAGPALAQGQEPSRAGRGTRAPWGRREG